MSFCLILATIHHNKNIHLSNVFLFVYLSFFSVLFNIILIRLYYVSCLYFFLSFWFSFCISFFFIFVFFVSSFISFFYFFLASFFLGFVPINPIYLLFVLSMLLSDVSYRSHHELEAEGKGTKARKGVARCAA